MTKKKSKISVFHDSLKMFGNSKNRKKKETAGIPSEGGSAPPQRRRSLPHDEITASAPDPPRELSAALQCPSHSDTSADNNALRRSIRVPDKSKLKPQSQKYATMKKTTSTVNLTANTKPLKREV
jgi:hypothetical protein